MGSIGFCQTPQRGHLNTQVNSCQEENVELSATNPGVLKCKQHKILTKVKERRDDPYGNGPRPNVRQDHA